MRVGFFKLGNGWSWLPLLILFLIFSSPLHASNEKVRLRLIWKHQFQFAGYYMAKEMGFYQQEGLDVEILEKDPEIDNVNEVVSGGVDFAVGRSSILVDRARGADVVALLAAYQHSPMMLLTLSDSGLDTPESLHGRRIMFAPDGEHASEIIAMLMKSGLAGKDYIHARYGFSIDNLVSGKTDAVAAYVSNEPYQLKKQGIKHNIIHPRDYGFDMYADILFTSGRMVKSKPGLVNRFYRASLRGWLYAFEHIDETISTIMEHYNTQGRSSDALRYEANVLKGLAFDEYGDFGVITILRLKQMMQIYMLANLIDSDVSVKDFIYHASFNQLHLSSKELGYISATDRINMCVIKGWMPYEDFMEGKHIGIVADYLRLLQQKIGIALHPVPVDTITQAYDMLRSGACGIISGSIPTVWSGRYQSYSIPYLSIPISVATRSGVDIERDMLDSVAVIRESAFEEIVRMRYPGVRVVPVEDGLQGLSLIEDGSVKGMLCTGAHFSNVISQHNIKDIVINDFGREEIGVSVAVGHADHLLLGLIDKAIRSISHEERENITNKWINVRPRPTIDPDIIWKLLIGFGIIILLAVYANWLMVRHNKRLSKMAGTDWLTQLPNRHSLIRKMEGFVNHSDRYSRALSLIYFDIDNFKGINDRFGHHTGDNVLKKLAGLLDSETRKSDACGRWGGEEFVLAMLEADMAESVQAAEKLRSKIEAHDFGVPVKVTCSFGVAQYESEEPLEHFIHRADLALYEAKSSGRNRVIAYDSV